MKNVIVAALAASSMLLSGCASIMGDNDQIITVNSQPEGAHFVVKDEDGVAVAQGVTPQTVTLAKSSGGYFGAKDYEIAFSKEGLNSVTVPVHHSVSGWYYGNIVFGGLIGWLAVDPFNGGMYNLKPTHPDAYLAPVTKTSDNA